MGHVEVYRNLHTGTWSVRANGRVIAHPDEVWLKNCTLVVQPGGRRSVLRTQRKNVHAFVRGTLIDAARVKPMIPITYDPYRYDSFVTVADLDPVHAARWVHLRADNTVWATF